MWSNWSLFQSCYFPMWFGKKSLHMKSKKYKEAWLTNLVSFKFSSCGVSWKSTSETRLLVTYRRNCFACTEDRASCRWPWIPAQLLMGKIKIYWWLNLKQIICAASRFMTKISSGLRTECKSSFETCVCLLKPHDFQGLLYIIYGRDHLYCNLL